MIHKKKCALCAKKFESVRSDKQYCSNACKQKAHVSRAMRTPEIAEKVFYLEEYTYLNEKWGTDSEAFPLIYFCFLRSGLASNVSRQTLESYFTGLDVFNNIYDLIRSNAFRTFEHEFLTGKKGLIVEKPPAL